MRIALVTGGGRGIGRACAEALAAAGAAVAVCGRAREPIEAVADVINAGGGRAVARVCDVSRADEVVELVKSVRGTLGAPDILVNNAGVARSAKFAGVGDDEWLRHLDVNLMGAVRVTREVLPGMLERRFGRVINVASVAGKIGFLYSTAYCASKHALLGFTRALALETAVHGVTVNAVCPGWVDTDMAADAVKRIDAKTKLGEAGARAQLEAMSPQKRLMKAEEVASVVAYLASDAASGVHGQSWNVDGGEVMS